MGHQDTGDAQAGSYRLGAALLDRRGICAGAGALDIASGASFIRKEPAITRRLTFEHDTDICSLTENVKRLLESSSKQEALRIVIDVHPAENT